MDYPLKESLEALIQSEKRHKTEKGKKVTNIVKKKGKAEKEESHEHKIKTWEALKMLKQVNPLLTNNEIPLEILNTVEELLENKDMGRNGYISIILTPVQDDTSDILEELNLDHTLVRIPTIIFSNRHQE